MVSEILCRIDPVNKEPVVFVTETLHDGKMKAWRSNSNAFDYVPLDFYHITNALSAEDERILMERYKKSTGRPDQVVKIRHRLPRSYKTLPNRIAEPSAPTQQPVQMERRQNSHAMPIERQPLPPVPPILSEREVDDSTAVAQAQAPTVAQATPAEVLNAIAQMSIEFNAKLAQLANLLAPAESNTQH